MKVVNKMGVHDLQHYFDIKRMLEIPGDEPIFIIRAQDKCAVRALLAYQSIAAELDASIGFLDHLHTCIEEFEEWQDKNRNRTKVPD